MKRYVKAYDYPQPKYPWGSSERRAKCEEHAKELEKKYPGATVQILGSIIYVISPDIGVEMYVVNDWGHCGILYGGFFDHVYDYLQDGGNIEDATFTDKLGNVYTPYKNRKSINVTFPNGSSIDLPRNKAAAMYLQNNKQGLYSPTFWGDHPPKTRGEV